MSLESEIKPKGKTETLLIHQEFLYYLKKKLEMYRKKQDRGDNNIKVSVWSYWNKYYTIQNRET